MKPKVATMHALTAYTALRALHLATMVTVFIIIGLFACIWALAYYLSPWWWIFLLPLSTIIIAVIILHRIITRTIHLIHRHPFTEPQRQALEDFTSKIADLTEFRDTPLPVYALITLRDIVRHQDAKTLRETIEDSTELDNDFLALEKHFGER